MPSRIKIKITEQIKRVIERDSKVIFTSTREAYPFVADRISGDFAYDIAGNKFIDFATFITVYSFGEECMKQVRRAVNRQIAKLMHSAFQDFYAEPPVALAEKLLSFMPSGFGRVFFSNSGTEANEDAIKIARNHTKRYYFLAFYNAFHGRSFGPLGLTASKSVQRHHLGPFPGFVHAIYPNPYRCVFNSASPEECADAALNYIEEYIFRKEAHPDEFAGIFIEPEQGEGGYVVPPKEFIVGLRKLASQYDIPLIDDEVQAGLMRTGKFLGLDNFGVKADIYTFAKAFGGGLPLGATVASKAMGDVPEGLHGGTFGGNLAAVAASNAVLDYIKLHKRNLEQAVARKHDLIMKRLDELKQRYEIVGDARGLGLMLAIELVKNKDTKEEAVAERDAVVKECFYNGLLLLPAGTSAIRIIPPITISEEHLEKGLDILENAVKKVSEQ
ncbi:MAG: aminotransferase class III-fold pyridoxal phosphate-dependent enzyme [Candidatus Micrarchaeia archaeon]